MTFPIRPHTRDERECASCQAPLAAPAFVFLQWGALTDYENRDTDRTTPYRIAVGGQICEVWAHDGRDEHGRSAEVLVDLADTPSHEYRVLFCSTMCLRRFFDAFVDHVEARQQAGVARYRQPHRTGPGESKT